MGGSSSWSRGICRRTVLAGVVVLQLIAGCWTAASAAAGPSTTSKWDVQVLDRVLAAARGDTVAVGDMLFHRSAVVAQRDQLAGLPAPAKSDGASGGGGGPLWTGGVIPYRFDPSVSAAHQEHFVDATREWSAFANVSFVVRTIEPDFVTVLDDPSISGGQSWVGRRGGEQLLRIGSSSWNRMTLLHEIGHTLGFQHEHQRSDRDSFVTILTANIIPGQEGNFVLLPGTVNYGPYDFLSVMHYVRNALSVDPATKDTVEPLPPYASYLNQIGAQFDRPLSTGDRLALAAAYGPPATPPSAVVTNTLDSGSGSLRAAMEYGFDTSEPAGHPATTVVFHIPPTDPGFDGTTFTIHPTASLPALGNRTIVDGSSQAAFGGTTNPNGPQVVINGSKVVAPEQYASGFVFRGAGSSVNQVAVNGFDVYGILITGAAATANTVTGCSIGTDAAGTGAVPDAFAGVSVEAGAHGNTIGGTKASSGNLLSGNSAEGVRLNGAGTTKNVVAGNTVGLGRTGAALANAFAGVGIFNGASSNTVGGTAAGARNTISGNASQGVAIADPGTKANVVSGNRIGTDTSGVTARANGFAGVSIYHGAQSNTVGGAAPGAGNVISGNANQGVTVSDTGTKSNRIQGNLIGLNATGTAPVPNAWSGVAVFGGATANTVGGTAAGARNTVSGNGIQGVVISGSGTKGNLVQGNRIGTDPSGATAIGNASSGLDIFGGAQANAVGGSVAGAGNLISGNHGSGATLSGTGTSKNVLAGNIIGLDAGAGTPVANAFSGVEVFGAATNNTIGGTAAAARNLLAGNGAYGVALSGAGTSGNLVEGNTVGTTPGGTAAPNAFAGVVLFSGARSNQIGGTAAGAGNLIAWNSGAGVAVYDKATTGNPILGNSLSANGALGIDLVGGHEDSFGVTANDPGDGDVGPNQLQNYPVLTAAVDTTTTTVTGSLGDSPSSTFRIELFASPTADPSTYGEGATFLGAVTVTTNGTGNATFTFATGSLVPVGQVVTATATDALGNTSELSRRVVVTT